MQAVVVANISFQYIIYYIYVRLTIKLKILKLIHSMNIDSRLKKNHQNKVIEQDKRYLVS
jgi:hypothetical protein